MLITAFMDTFSPNYKTKTAFSYKFRDEKTAFSDETRKIAFPFHKNRIFVAQLNLKKS